MSFVAPIAANPFCPPSFVGGACRGAFASVQQLHEKLSLRKSEYQFSVRNQRCKAMHDGNVSAYCFITISCYTNTGCEATRWGRCCDFCRLEIQSVF